jgi:cytochrome oxidase assembly protein ShyY1
VLAVLRRPSWVGFTLLVVVLCIAFVELGQWQLRRHDQRAAMNAVLTANLDQPAAEADAVLPVDGPLPPDEEWRLVRATGSYDTANQVLVRNQTLDGELGYEVITPLVRSTGPAILIMRGWVPAGLDARAEPTVPDPPTGEVAVQARVRPSEGTDAGTEGLPPHQVRRVAVAAIADDLPYQVATSGYASLVPGTPGSGQVGEGPRPVPPPQPSAGPHLAYAVQWYLFGVIAIAGWVILLRSAVRDEAGPYAATPVPTTDPHPAAR